MKLTVTLKKHDVSTGRGPFGGFEGFEKEWNFDDLDKMNFDFQAPDMTAVRDAVQRAKDEAMRAGDEARKAVRRLRIVTTRRRHDQDDQGRSWQRHRQFLG